MPKWKTIGLRFWILAVAAFAALGAGIVRAEFSRVDIVVQGPTGKKDLTIWTFHDKVKSILQQAGVRINRHDQISPKESANAANRPIVLRQAIPVTIKTAHHEMRVWTTRYHVQAALSAAHVKLGPLDLVRPGLNAKISATTTVNVIRRWLVTKKVNQPIPFSVQHQPDSQLAQGRTMIRVHGKNGLREETIQELVQQGQVVHQKVMASKVIAPVTEVIDYGTQAPVARGGPVIQFGRAIPMLSTAYWPDPAWSSGYTATGIKAQYGVAAVDPRVIPLGTRLYIPGYGFAIAADTGGAIIGDRIDLCYDSAVQADNWGVREVTVYELGS